jgi:hypothetical protein
MFIFKGILYNMIIFYGKRVIYYDSQLFRSFAMRWYGIEEFKLLLESIGFSNITCSADYVYEKEPSNANQIITFEAVRNE